MHAIALDVSASVLKGLGGDRQFHEIAKTAISDTQACERLSKLDLFCEVASTQLPSAIALENDFAYPTITIHRERDFRIELLFWRRGSEAYVHDHMAGGAFGVVVGRRVHVRFKFHPHGPETTPGVCSGELVADDAHVCDPGYICEIPPHDGLIHSLFYLDDIAVTLSIRQICDINTSALGSKGIVYKPHEGHYLAALRLSSGMGADSRKLATFIESSLSGDNAVERLPALISDLADHRPAAQLLAAASSESFATNSYLTETICDALGHRHPGLAGPVVDSLHWFGDKTRIGMVDEYFDESEVLFAWLLTMLCSRMMVIEVLSRALKISLVDAEQRMLAAAGRLQLQEIDFGAGPEPLIRSAPLLRTLESYGIVTAIEELMSPAGGHP
ncbi:hypothetical protein [Chromobacterium sp. IIBBL 290-4]|uniref:hypothetical protein n=1 Tax=Chromobacterium sp. IIBBL 290-4 TaxID=2953890 RepID=UPI0020B64CA9|nr:hypothetical protein [Chromobacterium sp. IIBBL 290-4]UTH74198.1 hypothetical protein NKT35_22105 [Chromobacterium sp. IIBBL 290-4]